MSQRSRFRLISYDLRFKQSALKEWKKLGDVVSEQFKAKLAERLERPHVPKDRLAGLADCYKIKLQSAGYRLVYQVSDHAVTVTVIAAGQRTGSRVYKQAARRL